MESRWFSSANLESTLEVISELVLGKSKHHCPQSSLRSPVQRETAHGLFELPHKAVMRRYRKKVYCNLSKKKAHFTVLTSVIDFFLGRKCGYMSKFLNQ